MVARRRRGRSKLRALRHFLLEHRFSAAEGVLGAVAVALGLTLLWPEGDDHRRPHGRWQTSLLETQRAAEEQPDLGGTFVASARASMAVSAKRELVGEFGLASMAVARRRLAQIAETMPEIGPPTGDLPLPANGTVQARPEPAQDAAVVVAAGSAAAAEPVIGVPLNGEAPAAEPPMPDAPPTSDVMLATDALDGTPQLAAIVPGRRPSAELRQPEWLRLAARPPVEDGRPKIAIVIDDLGNSPASVVALNRLPVPLTLAFLPYAEGVAAQAASARAAGHELLIHMPMEPMSTDWPGPDALVVAISEEEFQERLQRNFASFKDYVGINNHMGSRLTADHERLAMVMRELRARDLLFLDSKTTPASRVVPEARAIGVPFAQRDVFLDNTPEPGYVMTQLVALEQVARRQGFAIAIGHPYPATIQALEAWLPRLAERGFSLVPVSTIVALRTCSREPSLAGCRDYSDAEPVRALIGKPVTSEG